MVTACLDVVYGRVAALFAALRRLFATIAGEMQRFFSTAVDMWSKNWVFQVSAKRVEVWCRS